MDNKQFKKKIGNIAKERGFNFAFGGWYKESPECLFVLNLQKSNYANYYYLNLKIYVQGAFGNHYKIEKNLVKTEMAEFFTRAPREYEDFLNLEIPMTDENREIGIIKMFDNFVMPFSKKALSKEGIKELLTEKLVFLLKSVKETLEFHEFDSI